MTTLELLDKIVPDVSGKSRIELIKSMYGDYRLTVAQRRAIELFLFEPTKEQAFKAMDLTPKAWLFIRYVVSENEIVARLCEQIEHGKVNGTYTRVILINEGLKDLLAKLLESPCASELIRYQKKIAMLDKLKR